MIDVVALGELLVDFVCRETDDLGYPTLVGKPGGAPGNYLAAVKKYGGSCAMIGKVGDDAFGHLLCQTLSDAGIDLRGVSVSVERAEGSETLPAEGMSVAETAAAAAAHVETEEVSMHQRVFGRDTSKSVAEQVTEAEMVEPEAEQETEEPAEEAQAEEIAALPEAGAEETAAQEEAPEAENTEEQA